MTIRRTLATLACCLGVFAPVQASPDPAIVFDSKVFVERMTQDAGRALEPARQLSRGDRVVYLVNWHRLGGGGGFTVTNPLPHSVYYQGSANGDEEVSVDGGKSWGQLGGLRIGQRIATAEDVTHVRWRVAPSQAAKGTGRIAYSAIVR